jgi:hypothetical protein
MYTAFKSTWHLLCRSHGHDFNIKLWLRTKILWFYYDSVTVYKSLGYWNVLCTNYVWDSPRKLVTSS